MTPLELALFADIKRGNAAIPDVDAQFLATSLAQADWRQAMPPKIDNPEDLDNYPVGTVIRLPGNMLRENQIWQRVTRTSFCWSSIGQEGRFTSAFVLASSQAKFVEVLLIP